MPEPSSAETLARTWIERWSEGAPDLIPLAEGFTHTSPYGRVSGREKYLEWVKPMAARNVTKLTIRRTLAQGNQAAIHFEMQTPTGPIEVCDWVVVDDGQIAEIHSFYDATDLR